MTPYRIFPTQPACQAWCDSQFVQMVRARAATMTRQELDDHWNLPSKVRIPDMPDSAINGNRFPLYGKNQSTGAWNTAGGFTTAWAVPRQTADGQWAAECRDPNDPQGQPEPAWPDPGPI